MIKYPSQDHFVWYPYRSSTSLPMMP